LLVSLILFFSFTCANSETELEVNQQPPYPCTWTDPSNGDKYDLSKLVNNTGDYFQNVTAKKWWVWINICRGLVINTCGTVQGGVGACQQWDPQTPQGKALLGTSSSVVYGSLQRGTKGQKGLSAKYSGGLGGRSFELDLQCTPKGGIGTPTFEIEQPTNYYNFGWATQYACPTNDGPSPSGKGKKKLSGGSIILILLLCLMIVYIAAGITYNKVRKQAAGLELIPNVEFWTSLPGLVKDGVMFIVNKTCRRGGGYQQV